MSRAQGKRLNKEDGVDEVSIVKEIIIKEDEDVKPIKIESFEDLPWNSVESIGFSTKIRRLFRS